MQIGVTIPLQKFLKASSPPYGPPEDLFYCWEAHVIFFQGKETLVAVNASSRFAVVLWGMAAADWAGYPELLKEGIALGLSGEGYTDEQVQAYFKRAGRLSVTKTHGRRPVAGLNRAVERLFGLTSDADKTRKYQALHSRFANEERCSAAGFSDKGCPRDFLEEDMKRTGILKQKEI